MMDASVVLYKEVPVITTKQVAESYGTTAKKISNNFNTNKEKFKEGKHFYCLSGLELKKFKDYSRNSGIALGTAPKIYLWTERGALLHAKSTNTDVAWEAYERLVDFYFCKQENAQNRVECEISYDIVTDDKNFYERNKDAIWAICNERGIKPRELYHQILTILSDKYNLEGAKRHYARKNGMQPQYIMDVIDFIPELSETADRIIGRICYNMFKK